MKLVDEYFNLQQQIYAHFGYTEDWVVIPLNDCREYYWMLVGKSGEEESVMYSSQVLSKEIVDSGENLFEDSIYRQRFLPKWIYQVEDYTMICVDTHTDGNKFLSIFDNSKQMYEGQLI